MPGRAREADWCLQPTTKGRTLEPRALSEDEQRVLSLLLANELESETLLAQLPLAQVTRHWVEDLPSVDIVVAHGAQRARTTERVLPFRGQVTNEKGEPTGLIIVWLEDGALAGLEYAWYTDELPDKWPSNDRIDIELRSL